MPEKKEIKVCDLFCGIGGFRLGLENVSKRFKTVWACDIDKYAIETYNKNFNEKWKPTDITKVRTADIPDFDLLCAGFPCQSFSIAGRRAGFKDTRGTLFFEICRVAQDKKPSLLLLENVKGLLSHDKGRTFAVILSSLDELGYNVEWQVLNSKDFGVPQNRERIFIIGHLGNGRGREIFPIGENDEIYSKKNTSQSSYLKSPLRSQGDKPLIIHNIYGGFNEEELRVFEDYSPTIRTPKGGGHLPLVMCNRIRRLTLIECERLQSFPDGWTEEGVSDTQRYKQLGNAVTVNVVEAIGKKILEAMD